MKNKKVKGHFWSLSNRPPVNPSVKKTKKLTEKFDISLRKFKKIESPKMVQKNGPENEVLAPEKAQTAVKKVEDCGNRTLLPQLWGALTVPFNRG